MKTSKILHLDQLDLHSNQLVNSPRSLEACRRQGIEPKELCFKSEKKFKKELGVEAAQLSKGLLQMHFEHFEQKRRDKIHICQQERVNVLSEEQRGEWTQFSPLKGSSGSSQGRKAASMASGSRGVMVGDSAMIEKERQALERIKLKQQKEVEQLMEYEKKMQAIRDRNEDKQTQERAKEDRRQREFLDKQKQQETRKLQEEEKKRLQAEEEAEGQRLRQNEQYRKDQEKAEQQRHQEVARTRELREKEEERKHKQEEFQRQTEQILLQQQMEVERRKKDMEDKDEVRREFLLSQQRQRQAETEQKRLEKERKIQQVRQNEEEKLALQRRQFEEKERHAEEQRRNFEGRREQERLENERQAREKADQIELVKRQNEMLEEQRKQEFLRVQHEAEERKRNQDQQGEHERVRRMQEEQEKNRYREEVRVTMMSLEDQRKHSILKKRQQLEEKVQLTQKQRDEQMRFRKEVENLKRKDRRETVERIGKINEYKKEKVLEKIVQDDMRSHQLKDQKNELLVARLEMRKHADLQKQEMVRQFETMKLKGKTKELSKLGFEGSSFQAQSLSPLRSMHKHGASSSKNLNPHSFVAEQSVQIKNQVYKGKSAKKPQVNKAQAQQKIDQLRQKHNQELLQILEEEQNNEGEREEKLRSVTEENERRRLEKIFGIERAKASERIVTASSAHEVAMNKEMKKWGLF